MQKMSDSSPEINTAMSDSAGFLRAFMEEEETNLARLMSEERYKTLFDANGMARHAKSVEIFQDINESISRVVKNLTKIQTLLQPRPEGPGNATPRSVVRTAAQTATQAVSPAAAATRRCARIRTPSVLSAARRPQCVCCLLGSGKGVVANRLDRFYNRSVSLSVFISPGNRWYNSVRYTVGDDGGVYMRTDPTDINYEYPSQETPDRIRVWGTGKLVRMPRRKGTELNVTFELLVWLDRIDEDGFQITIQSDDGRTFIHDSGFVKTNGRNGTLRLS